MLQSHFDLDPGLIYLNAGLHSLCPREVLEAVNRYQKLYERNPSYEVFQTWGRLWKIQQELAGFFDARPEDLFLRHNVTAVLNALVLGAKVPAARGENSEPGEFLASDLEYGAIVNVAKYRAEREGYAFRTFSLPAGHEEVARVTEQSLVDTILAAIRPSTRLLLLSQVVTGNGLILPIRRIAAETRKRGIVLIVDGAHATGALPLRLSELEDVDYYAGNLHKWMMGPKGTAFGWVAPRNQESLEPHPVGWTTFETPLPFLPFGNGSRFPARYLLSACHDFAPFLAIHETLLFWRQRGAQRIVDRIYELQEKLEQAMDAKLGLPKVSPPLAFRGPLLSYRLPERLEQLGHELMHETYRRHGLQIAVAQLQGSWVLRLSPHIHNTDEDIERAVQILKEVVQP